MPAVEGSFANLLSTKWQKALLSVGKEVPLQYPEIVPVEDMDTNPWQSFKVSGLGAMPQKPEGQQFENDQPIQGGSVTVTAIPFGMLFEVSFEMYCDDLYSVMEDMWKQEGKSARYRQEVSAWSIFNLAFTSTQTGYDAVQLVSTAHTLLNGATASNRPATDITLSQTGIQAGQLAMRQFVDDRGIPMDVEPTTLVINEFNRAIAWELLASSGKPYTANNETNALIPTELMAFPTIYLTRNNDWFLTTAKGERDCALMWRNRPIPRHFDDPFTMNGDFTLYQRYGIYIGDWRWIYGSSVGT